MRYHVTQALLISFLMVSLLTGCQSEQANPAKNQSSATSLHIQKALEYTKRTGHEVCCRALFYTEDGAIVYYRTAGDYRRKGLGGEIPSTVPDDKEICWACQDCTTGISIDGLCLTTAELESMGRIPKTSHKSKTTK